MYPTVIVHQSAGNTGASLANYSSLCAMVLALIYLLAERARVTPLNNLGVWLKDPCLKGVNKISWVGIKVTSTVWEKKFTVLIS